MPSPSCPANRPQLCRATVFSLSVIVRIIVELFGCFVQSRMTAVLFRENHVRGVDPPVDTDLRVVPCDRPLALRGVVVVAFILEDSLLAQHDKSVRESAGDEQLTLVFARKLDGHKAAEGRRAAADVHGHIQYGSRNHAHQLALGMRRLLEVQPAKHPVGGLRFVVLHEAYGAHRLVECAQGETLEEIAPPVAENLRFHNNDSIQVGFDDMHKCCVYGPYFPRFCRLRCGTNGSTRKPLPFHLALSRRAACF